MPFQGALGTDLKDKKEGFVYTLTAVETFPSIL